MPCAYWSIYKKKALIFRPLKKWENYSSQFIPTNKLHDPPLTGHVEKKFV